MSSSTHRIVQHGVLLPGVETMTLATSHRFPRHSHDEFGLGLLMFGGQRSWSGRGFVEAYPDDLISVNPGEMHDGSPLGRQPRGWQMIYICPSALSSIMPDRGANGLEFAQPSFDDAQAKHLFSRLFTSILSTSADSLLREERLVALLGHVLARWGARRVQRQELPPAVSRALERLNDDPVAKVSLAELASLAGVSRFQLLRGFAHHVGVTPHAYLIQCRARLARELLLSGEPPAHVAVAAGFADQSHLTRVLHRQFCVTPAKIRKAARRD